MPSRGAMQAVGIACLLFAIGTLALAAPIFYVQYSLLQSWQSADAIVRKSEVVELTMAGTKLYATRFEFGVLTPGLGERPVQVNSFRQSSDYKMVAREVERFPVGKQVLVRVNPNNPFELKLDTDQPRRYFVLPLSLAITAGIFLITSIAVLIFARYLD